MGTSSQKVQEGHPDGDPGRHLVEYPRLIAIRKVVGQFDSPVDRSGVHDHRVVLGQRKKRTVQAIP